LIIIEVDTIYVCIIANDYSEVGSEILIWRWFRTAVRGNSIFLYICRNIIYGVLFCGGCGDLLLSWVWGVSGYREIGVCG
jgi:hypothetical protein